MLNPFIEQILTYVDLPQYTLEDVVLFPVAVGFQSFVGFKREVLDKIPLLLNARVGE
jgi:hypothetical protein